MRVLIACEFSGIVRDAFIAKGHDAMSCDLLPTEKPGPHYQGDIIELLESKPDNYWNLIILHPDCTFLALSGNRWYGKNKPGHIKRITAIGWTIKLWEIAKQKGDSASLENPTSVIFKRLNADLIQYIQPWQFGHGETKKTGLALHCLQPLKPTNIAEGREQRIWKMPPSPNRKKERSRTFQGIAKAMADQWGKI